MREGRLSQGRHDTPSVSFSHFNNFLPPPPPLASPPFGAVFNIPGWILGISVVPAVLLPMHCVHINSNVCIKSAVTNQKPFSSCLVLQVLLPSQWLQNWSWSLSVALWLHAAPEFAWAKFRQLIPSKD